MEANQKTQVVERLRQAQNVLITVSADPSVDQLASAIGLALMMNKLSKHATAVFSGVIPSTLEFLKPEETLEQSTDSLRDFIISLDKAKADKLRYKVEENVVKIFITPYRTSLSEADLNFEQGDYNVDVVIALGVDQQEHIDQAIMAHGRIFHDATVIGVMAGSGITDVGSINWMEPNASSLCEMLVSISEAFQGNLLDGQMATAFLTGIVANTERFSNEKTTPKVMTMSAQLMAAGANQQLISNELTPPVQELIVEQTPPEPPAVEAVPIPVEAVNLQPEESKTETPNEQSASDLIIDTSAEKEEAITAPQTNETEEEDISPPMQLPPSPLEASIPPPAPQEIKIDEQGTLSHVGDLADVAAGQVAARNSAIIKKGPDITPPFEKVKKFSNYMTQAPANGGTFTGAGLDDLEPSIDPLSAIPEAPIPSLPEQNPQNAVEPQYSSADLQEPSDQPIQQEGVVGVEGATFLETDAEGKDLIQKSMADLEASVKASGQPFGQSDAAGIDADAARQAVNSAVESSDYDGGHPQPAAALNAMPLGEDLHQANEQSQSSEDMTTQAPPSVPPPLVPPFSSVDGGQSSDNDDKNEPNLSVPSMPLPPSS